MAHKVAATGSSTIRTSRSKIMIFLCSRTCAEWRLSWPPAGLRRHRCRATFGSTRRVWCRNTIDRLRTRHAGTQSPRCECSPTQHGTAWGQGGVRVCLLAWPRQCAAHNRGLYLPVALDRDFWGNLRPEQGFHTLETCDAWALLG